MAFFDDKKMLLAHIRHSFVTSDDTGTIDNDYVNKTCCSILFIVFFIFGLSN